MITWRDSLLLLLCSCSVAPSIAFAQGTAFTYQGRLDDGANPANGNYDLRFAVYDALTNGSLVAGVITNTSVPISNALFTVALDFGLTVFDGSSRWLEIGARTNGAGAFTTLNPRQPLTSTPYAVRAAYFSGAVADAQLSANIARLNGNQTFTGAVSFSSPSNSYAGSFSGNGVGLTNVDINRLTSGALTWGSTFLAGTLSAGFQYPDFVVATDVNGDGFVDFVIAGHLPQLAVLTNNGAGTSFAISGTYLSGTLGVSTVAVADVNGDGKPDLICAIINSNILGVLTNDGHGGFGLAAMPTLANSAVSVAAADVNGDGRMDLLCVSTNANVVSILTNNGSGGFVAASSPPVGLVPACVIAVDVNGDGKIDLVTANSGENTLTVLTNNGSGGFATAASLHTANNPISVVAADVNSDGRVDLLSVSFGGSLTVQTNNGAGGFGLLSIQGTGAAPLIGQPLAMADVNGDGIVDVIVSDSSLTGLVVATNDGRGVFTRISGLEVYAGGEPFAVTTADVNGDGRPDLISANSLNGTVEVMYNTPALTGVFSGVGMGLDLISHLDSLCGLTNALTVQCDGTVFIATNLGVGTISPQVPIHARAPDARVRLEATSATKYSATEYVTDGRTWHTGVGGSGVSNGVIGKYYVYDASAAQFRLVADTAGNVGINTATPAFTLDVNGSAHRFDNSANWTVASDRRFKRNIAALSNSLDVLERVRPVRFQYTEGYIREHPGTSAAEHFGVVAQEFKDVFPDYVTEDNSGMLSVDISPLTFYNAAALRELHERLKQKEKDIVRLERANQDLQQRLERLENLVLNRSAGE